LAIENLPFHGLVRVFALPRLQLLLEVCCILLSAASVGHDIELVRQARNDGVVDNTSSLGVQKRREGGLMLWKGGEGGWRDALEKGLNTRTREVMLDPEPVNY
jgi:hypothetical protein